MSYILDALKKAESERERGLVPGLHAQPLSSARATGARQAASQPLLLLAAVALLALLVGAGLWWRAQTASPKPGVVVAQRPTPAAVLTPPALVVESAAPALVASSALPAAATGTVVPPAAVTAAEPAVTRAPTQGSAMAPAQITPLPAPESTTAQVAPAPPAVPNPVQKPVPVPVPVAKPAPKPVAPATPPVQTATRVAPVEQATAFSAPAAPVPMAATAPPAVAPAKGPISNLSELPADVRLALPKLVISGSTYSDTPAYRMLIINGQVFHEGEKIATDMQLLQIRPNAAVLDYKGQRYSMPY